MIRRPRHHGHVTTTIRRPRRQRHVTTTIRRPLCQGHLTKMTHYREDLHTQTLASELPRSILRGGWQSLAAGNFSCNDFRAKNFSAVQSQMNTPQFLENVFHDPPTTAPWTPDYDDPPPAAPRTPDQDVTLSRGLAHTQTLASEPPRSILRGGWQSLAAGNFSCNDFRAKNFSAVQSQMNTPQFLENVFHDQPPAAPRTRDNDDPPPAARRTSDSRHTLSRGLARADIDRCAAEKQSLAARNFPCNDFRAKNFCAVLHAEAYPSNSGECVFARRRHRHTVPAHTVHYRSGRRELRHASTAVVDRASGTRPR